MKPEYKVIAIVQIYNELSKGNLERFFKYNSDVFDKIVVYDDGSTDGSFEYALKHTPYVIKSPTNNFENEIKHKSILLEYAKRFSPDFVFWIDADEVVATPQRRKVQDACQWCIENGYDGLRIQRKNLWRSNTYERVDTEYNQSRPVSVWRIKPNVSFENIKIGLHQESIPNGIEKIARYEDLYFLHYGFADVKNIVAKYVTYSKKGQRGYHLRRLVDETDLTTVRMPKEDFPPGLWIDESAPQKMGFESYYKLVMEMEKAPHVRFSVVSLIYKSVSWLEFVYRQVMIFTDLKDSEFFFVANDADKAVLDYLKINRIKYYVHDNTDEQKKEWYINNVYRAWNKAAEKSKGDFVVFINSDMAFTPKWLESLFSDYDGKNCVTSRLVESAKLRSGIYGIEKNFGRLISEYNEPAFQAYAADVGRKEVHDSGLYMPLLIKKSDYDDVKGYPEGNIVIGSDVWNPKIATKTDHLMPGDQAFMLKLADRGIKHKTSFSSIVYHFQCGEMDDLGQNGNIRNWRRVFYLNKSDISGAQQNYQHALDGLEGVSPLVFKAVSPWDLFLQKIRVQLNPTVPVDVEVVIAPLTEIEKLPETKNRRYVFIADDDQLPTEQEKNIYDLALKDRVDCTIIISSMHNLGKFLFCEPKILNFSKDSKYVAAEIEVLLGEQLDILTSQMFREQYINSLGVELTKPWYAKELVSGFKHYVVLPHLKKIAGKGYRIFKSLVPMGVKQTIKTLIKRA